jgi:hypothetical protein
MQLLITITPRGTRYYMESQRITKARYYDHSRAHRLECFQTVIKGDTTRHYVCARTP